MDLEEARDLKRRALASVVEPAAAVAIGTRALGSFAASDLRQALRRQPQRTMALGIARDDEGSGFRLAVRLQRRSLQDRPELEQLRKLARDKLDVKFVGRIEKRAGRSWYQQRARPLSIGVSIGHHQVTAGTLGAFVRLSERPDDPALYVLSNNHVLANENRAKVGDAVLQPGTVDGGISPNDVVARLEDFVRIEMQNNLVDAAIARLDPNVAASLVALRGLGGKFKGLSSVAVDEGLALMKLGRTTGVSRGRVTAFELDDVIVAFDVGNRSFDGQIEIEGQGDRPFSDGGDSGSLIVDETLRAVALLFAGSDSGGSNGKGLTYANPIGAVMSALKVDFALS